MHALRKGFALIDVLVGVTVFAIGASTLTALLTQHAHAAERHRMRERETLAAAEQLTRIATLWTNEQFARAPLRAGAFALGVAEVAPSVFDVTLADTASRHAILTTTIYRAPGRGDEQ